MEIKRILVSGASGFVGCALIRALSEREGIDIYAGVHDRKNSFCDSIKSVSIDITQARQLNHILEDIRPHVVINAASYGVHPDQLDSQSIITVNTLGAVVLLEAAARAGCQRFIQLGSCSEYGGREGLVHEDMSATPTTLYGATKAAATVLIQERGDSLGMDTLILRLFNIWGEYEAPHRIFPAIVAACQDNNILELTDGMQLKDYSYVGDMVEWIISIAIKPESINSQIINIASGKSIPLRDFILQIAEKLRGTEFMRFGVKDNRITEAREQMPDLSKLESLLPCRRITPVNIALERAIGFYNISNQKSI